jgi:hypothetical protein
MLNTTSSVKKLPGQIDTSRLITMLFGSDTICKIRKIPLSPQECAVVGTYHDNEKTLQRLLVCDLAFANSAGAALSTIPATAANNSTKAGRMDDSAFENLYEVLNVAVNLFIETFGGRLELGSVYPLAEIPPELSTALSSLNRARLT